MSPQNSDVTQGLGETAERTVLKAVSTSVQSKTDEIREKEDAYLERFREYCDKNSLQFAREELSSRGNVVSDAELVKKIINQPSLREEVIVFPKIGPLAVASLGADSNIDPGFFAHHLQHLKSLTDSGLGTKTTKSYWSVPLITLLPKSRKGDLTNHNLCWQLSFTTLKHGHILLLLDQVSWYVKPTIGTEGYMSVFEDIFSVTAAKVMIYDEDLLGKNQLAPYIQKILTPSKDRGLLQEMLRAEADNYDARITLGTVLNLKTWGCILEQGSYAVRKLETDATVEPSKKVLAHLNQARSLVLRVLDDVIHQRDRMRSHSPETYILLCDIINAARRQHSNTNGISDSKFDHQVLDYIFSRLEHQAKKQSAQLRETFQTLATSIAIEDAEFNKKQAQRSTMLTLLAAIYLPLSLTTGIFGMNVQEINGGKPRWWVVLVVTAILFLPSVAFVVMLFAAERIKPIFRTREAIDQTSESRLDPFDSDPVN